MVSFSIGSSQVEGVLVTVHSYELDITGEYFDDNWVEVEVSVSTGAFSGHFKAAFLTEDFVRFHAAVQSLFETQKGEAIFSTLEDQLWLKVIGNGRGNIEVNGVAFDNAGVENELRFRFELDQTYLSETIRGLNDVITAFPIRRA